MSNVIQMNKHPLFRVSSADGSISYVNSSDNFSKSIFFVRVGFLVIANFYGNMNTYEWLNSGNDVTFPVPYGYNPCVKTVAPVTGSSYNCMLVFGTDGHIHIYGYGLGYIHGVVVYPTADPLLSVDQ